MLRIGYVRLRDHGSAEDTARLKAAGCHVVRAEDPMGGPEAAEEADVLASILDFISEGDQLVVPRLEQLGDGARAALYAIDRLEARGASLLVLEPEICSQGVGGTALRAALHAVAALEPGWVARRRRGQPAADEIRALQAAGVGPVEIARRLGVSRMTVWRKLKAVAVEA